MSDYDVMKDLTFDERDEFSRKPIAEKIIKLLDSDIDVSPLIIDGKWGTGKTEFCFKFKNLITECSNNYKIGYVNAFQADHANEPLLTLIAEVAGFYDEKNDNRKNFIASAIPYLRLVTGIGVKATLGFALGRYGADIPEEFASGMEEIKEGSKSLIDQSLESLIKDQVEAEKNLTTLKEALTDIASFHPIILIIDELDRCRPDFAVMMLETIKHAFDVKNVKIILVTNVDQLKATIKHSYGSETNSHDYLYKFFKYQINLPTTVKDIEGKSIENNVTYFRSTVEKSKVIPSTFKNNEFIYEIPTFLNHSKLSLRNIEQIVRCIETLIIFEDKDESYSPIVEQIMMVFLSFIYVIDKELLNEILKQKINQTTSINFINYSRLTLPTSRNLIEDSTKGTNSLLVVILSKYLEGNYLNFPNHNIDYFKYQDAVNQLGQFLVKYQFHNETNSLINGKENNSYIYKYIDHTINNLLLFDIVK